MTASFSLTLRRAVKVGFANGPHGCPSGQGRMKLLALVKSPASIARTLATVGEAGGSGQRGNEVA